MAETNNTDGGKTAPESKTELPHVESPSISPAISDADRAFATAMAQDKQDKSAPADNAIILTIPAIRIPKIRFPKFAMPKMPHLAMPHVAMPKIARRTQRNVFFTASLMLAACCGAAAGALAIVNTPRPQIADMAADERIATQKTIEQMSREIAALKTGIMNAGKAATTQIGKIAERVEKIERVREATGSIAAPPPAVAAMPEIKETPIPTPKPTILTGWTVIQARGNGVLVESRGELFLARPGATLPGLGTVESVKRDGTRWVVTTPKGIIVSDAGAPQRPRGYGYYGPFQPY